jgi:superfamily II DNA or RNA helicase
MKPKSTKSEVEIVVKNVYSQVNGLQNRDALRALDQQLSYFVSGYQFTKAYKTGWWDNKKHKWDRWDGKNHLLTKNHKFLTGLLSRVKSVLKNHNIKYKLTDLRKDVPFKRKIKTKNIEEREYQKRVLEATLKHKGGIVQSATGSGKSVMITQLIANTNVKTMVYVIGVDLLYQMKETFEKMLGTKVGIIGDGQADIRKINVCTVWTAANALGKKYIPFDDEDRSTKEKFDSANKEKIAKAIKSTEMAIYDECQMLAAKTLQLINVSSSSALYKYGFSGTPYREDNADLLLEAVCGKIIAEVTASELIKKGYLVKPKIQFVSIPEYDGAPGNKYPTVYKEYIVENDVRNTKIVKIAEKLVEKGRRVLILVKNIKHGKTLLSMFPKDRVVYFVKGNVKSEERNRIRGEFTKGKIDIIVASVVYDQGIDLPNLDALILTGSGKSAGRTLQRLGRVIRAHPGKKDAIVIDFIDNAKYLLEHTTSRIETYKREVAFSLKFPERILNAKSKKSKKQKTAPKRLQKFEEW